MTDNVVLTTPNTEAINNPMVSPGDRGEPPHEWASATLEALGPATSKSDPSEGPQLTNEEPTSSTFAADASSTVTTPGVPIPGAYPPDSHARSSSISEDAQYVKDVTTNALETAKGYVFTASEQVGAKVGEYLPESVASYLPPSLHPAHSDTKDSAAATPPTPEQVATEAISTSTSASPETHPREDHGPKSETKQEGTPGSFLSPPSRGDGASEDASTRTLPGSRAFDKKSTNTVTESDSYSYTAAPHVAECPQLNAELMRKSDDTTNPGIPVDSEETRWHAPDPDAPGQESPNVTARDDPVGTVDVKGFTHQDSFRSDEATPGHSDTTALVEASPAMPPGVGSSYKGKEKERDVDHGQDDALTKVGNHAITASSGIIAADLAETGAAPAMAGAGTATGMPGADAAPPPPSKDKEAGTKETPSPTSTTDSSNKRTVPSEPAAGKPPSFSSSQSKAGAGKTKSGFMDKIKGEMKVLSGKLEHKQEKVEEGKKMMGKSSSKN